MEVGGGFSAKKGDRVLVPSFWMGTAVSPWGRRHSANPAPWRGTGQLSHEWSNLHFSDHSNSLRN